MQLSADCSLNERKSVSSHNMGIMNRTAHKHLITGNTDNVALGGDLCAFPLFVGLQDRDVLSVIIVHI